MHCVGEQREISLRFLAEPSDVNFGGKIHGGAVMKWIDHAGYTCAVGWSGSYCVTVYVGGIQFYAPVHVGSLVEVQAKVIQTGRTSMHVAVDVFASDPRERRFVKTTHCIIVFVSVEDGGAPRPVPQWVPITEAQKAEELYARRLVELRKGIEAEMKGFAAAGQAEAEGKH